jgi:hypothetical protein
LNGLKETVAKGVSKGIFGYVMGAAVKGERLSLISREALTFKEQVTADEIDLSAGSYIVSAAYGVELATGFKKPGEAPPPPPPEGEPEDDDQDKTGDDDKKEKRPQAIRVVQLHFRAKGSQLFSAFTALQNLSEWADEVFEASVMIEAAGSKALDRNTYEMTVLMPLEEEGVEIKKS